MSVLGRIVSAPQIERGIEVSLRYFLGTYIGQTLVQAGHPIDALPDPQDLVRVAEMRWPVESQVTTMIVASPGTVGTVVREAEFYTATWDVTVGVICDLGDRLDTREAALFYAAAAGACVSHQGVAVPNLDGTWSLDDDGEPLVLEGSSVRWVGETARPMRSPDGRLLIIGEARLNVTVEDARSVLPLEPLPLPDLPAPPDREPPVTGDRVPVEPDVTVEKIEP